MSRIVIYTNDNVISKRRHDLEDDKLSAIWLEVGLPGKKKILIGNAYREWQYMSQNDNSSLHP